jgi:phosphoglycolate phosphatase
MIKAIIFDFDFTLADSSEGTYQCINYALQELGYDARSLKDIRYTIGLSLENTFIKLTGNTNQELSNQFKKLFIQCADKVMSKKTTIYKTVPKTVKALKGMNIKLGIVSTKYRYRINDILNRYKLKECFDIIVGGEDVIKMKPDPEGILKLIDNLKINKEESVYIGDSVVDAETAMNSGIRFIPVLTGTTKKEEFRVYSPIFYLNKIDEILNVHVLN